ncbi:Rv2578c family radical SAM protein [Arthrobacter yangruifuii]|uniref:Rv2578c family radical SAM protein n=1 Tax=Arthrobacter yangruifuii TaxID=2606616 RepID=UPI0011B6C322|nr:Rv2578c family radical SAM protein [Arthrobacter yangruifuii]
MRWQGQELNAKSAEGGHPGSGKTSGSASAGAQVPGAEVPGAAAEAVLPLPAVPGTTDPLIPLQGLVRSVRTPDFAGVTFHEVVAKSVLNKVGGGSNMPFEWTVNPYRGCSHACVYCFARKTHTYLDLDSGADFDSQLVVKVNAAEVLRRELARPSWQHHHVAMGTNTDPYQRAEGRYKLMPGIIRALADSGTPFSILTKGTLLARDIPLLKEASAQTEIGMGISLALVDPELAKVAEPGTPTPRARLELISRLRDAGLPCSVMAMPILPWLTDGDESLDALFSALAAAGATGVTAGALHLRPGAREWYLQFLARHYPELSGKYADLYGKGTYASKEYRDWLAGRIRFFKAKYGFSGGARFLRPAAPKDEGAAPAGGARTPVPAAGQDALF